jgi:hypothetical protein
MENNKQWILETLAHRNSGRVPYNFMFSPPARRVLEAHYQTDKIEERFNFPIRMSVPSSIKPLYAEPDTYGPIIKDEFGVMWTTSYIDRGAPIGPCLRKPDLTHYRFPDAHREYRFSGLPQWCEENSLHYTIIWVGDLWERATFMCSMEKLLTYVVTDDSFVEALLHGITDYILQTMDIVFERCKFDGIALSDDYGAQNAILRGAL